MLKFLRVLFGCSRREAAHDEDFERERAARAEVRAEIAASVRETQRLAREMDAAGRLLAGVQRDFR